MSGLWHEVWSPRLCSACQRAGKESHLKIIVIDEGPLSSAIERCFECRFATTLASAVGNDVRAKLLQLQRRARTHVVALLLTGLILGLSVMGVAVSALAAVRK